MWRDIKLQVRSFAMWGVVMYHRPTMMSITRAANCSQSPRVGEPSSSSNRLVKRKNPELVESEGQKEFASERRHCGRESFPWQCRRIQNQPRMTVSHDSLAGSSGDSMRNIVGIVHFTESTIRQQLQIANDISHEVDKFHHTHKDTLGDKQVSNTLQRPAAKQQNAWRL